MSHVQVPSLKALRRITRKQYRDDQMKEPRWQWAKNNLGVSDRDLADNFQFLNAAVLTRPETGKPLLTTTGLFGPIRTGTVVSLATKPDDKVNITTADIAPFPDETLIEELNALYDQRAGKPPKDGFYTRVVGYWTAAVDGAGIAGLGGSANVFGSTGQLILSDTMIRFPLIKYTDPNHADTLAYYGGRLLSPNEPFALGFTQDLWGIQYNQVQPGYIQDYQLSPSGGGGLFVEHHPFPHIWLPGDKATVSKILLGRRIDTYGEDAYYNPVLKQSFDFSMFEVPNDGSALAIRPQTVHNDSFTLGAQTVFLGNTAANTVALRQSAPLTHMETVTPPA